MPTFGASSGTAWRVFDVVAVDLDWKEITTVLLLADGRAKNARITASIRSVSHECLTGGHITMPGSRTYGCPRFGAVAS